MPQLPPALSTALSRHALEMAVVLSASHVVPVGHAASQLWPTADM